MGVMKNARSVASGWIGGGDMRLIDADTLAERIKIHKINVKCGSVKINEVYGLAHDHIIDLVNNQPTAYDVDAVVEQIMVLHDEGYCPNEDELECVLDKACSDCYREKVADIIRKGGKE